MRSLKPFAVALAAWSVVGVASGQDAVPAEGGGGEVPPAVRVAEVFGGDGGFAFDVQVDDVAETFTDLAFLNDDVADRKIVVEDGRFTYADTGERVRFWATNIGADNAFPTKEHADMIARRLAKLGVNMVRLHHLDNEWMRSSGEVATLWPATGAHDRFVPEARDRLDYLIHALKQNGVYVNLNLKVSKELSDADGMPEGWDEIPFVHQKRVDRFFPLLVEHQKWYARELLTHENPYTGLTYAEDPAVALIEINNENSIMHLWPGMGVGAGLETLPRPYREELQRQWNAWLKDRYGSDEAVREAWLGDAPPAGGPVQLRGEFVANGMMGASMDLEPGEPVVARVTTSTGTDWHAQALLGDVPLEEGKTYTVRFTAKAENADDAEHAVRVSMDRDLPNDYANVGLDLSVVLGPEPRELALPFKASGTVPGDADAHRVAFNLGAREGTVTIGDFRIIEGYDAPPPVGSLSDASYPVTAEMTAEHRADWVAFLAETERAFSDSMRSLLRDELGVDKPIADSQAQWGGASSYHREALAEAGGSEFVDTHNYWQHPSFAGGDWNPEDWTITNSSMVEAFARGENGPLGLAEYRVAGHPFGVSEIDQPAPSDWAVELVPVISTFAAAQDWDAVYTFAGGNYSEPDAPLNNYFAHLKHTAKAGQYPAAALIFRRGLIPPAAAVRTLATPDPLYPHVDRQGDAWSRTDADHGPAGRLAHRYEIDYGGGDFTLDETAGDSPLSVTPDHGGLYTAVSDRAAVAVGHLGDGPVELGEVTFTPTGEGVSFGSVSLVPLDEEPLARSRRMLLTVIGRAQNQAMGWNADRTSVGTAWGEGPMLVQTPGLTLTLPREGLAVYALDPTGARKQPLTVQGREVTVSPDDETIYYEVRDE